MAEAAYTGWALLQRLASPAWLAAELIHPGITPTPQQLLEGKLQTPWAVDHPPKGGDPWDLFWPFYPNNMESVGGDVTQSEIFEDSPDLPFSPTAQNADTFEILLLLAALKLGKTPEGLKMIEKLALKYMDVCDNTVSELSRATHTSNFFTAHNNQMIQVSVLKRLGLISNIESIHLKYHLHGMYNHMKDRANAEVLTSGITAYTAAAAKVAGAVIGKT